MVELSIIMYLYTYYTYYIILDHRTSNVIVVSYFTSKG